VNVVKANGIIIFDKDNPNFFIKNSNDEIIEMFKNKYVPILYKEKIIGFVSDTEFFAENKLIGDVILWLENNDKIPLNLKNYEFQVCYESGFIKNIVSIEFE
jgi:hypothetical protein